MTHYATLRNHKFDSEVADIRGKKLFGEGGQKLANIDDILLEHSTGNIDYLVANQGHGRRVLIPLSLVRTGSNSDLGSDLTKADINHLPAFDEKILKHDRQWSDYLLLHRQVISDREQKARRALRSNVTCIDRKRTDQSDRVTSGLGPKWEQYQETVRQELPRLRRTCETCSRNGKAKVA